MCEGVAQQKKRDESELREISLLDHEEMKATVRYACSLHPDELGVCPMDLVAPSDFLCDPDPPQWAADDVTNEPLDPALVRKARAEEIEYFRQMGVYRKVPLATCLQATGKKPISVRWIDINKGGAASPRYRLRLVAKEYNNSKQPELFAATPPAEGLKLMLSKLAQGNGKTRLLYADVSRAYFYAPAVRPVYVALPAEYQDPSDPTDTCGELAGSMYGTRDAAFNWAEEYSSKLSAAAPTPSLEPVAPTSVTFLRPPGRDAEYRCSDRLVLFCFV